MGATWPRVNPYAFDDGRMLGYLSQSVRPVRPLQSMGWRELVVSSLAMAVPVRRCWWWRKQHPGSVLVGGGGATLCVRLLGVSR
ncbi:hypothetical protein GOP47_0012247 [Adiantum capillus-veneris]|uniref:Uncharacterized protein n=1 Tax=Adiantum capillus-veneris TaxID=13818 RepID=A0A9D4UQK3_ADICA|nr:hypothetical protein GOP47_0012247 [Adiantum capillus-veneris]